MYIFEKDEERNDFIVSCRNTENMVYYRDPKRANVFIIRENRNYFPIFLIKKTIKDVDIDKFFMYSNLLEHIWNYFESNCKGINLSSNVLPIAKVLYSVLGNRVTSQIIDSRNKCRYLVCDNVLVPVKPSGCLYDVPIENDYRKYIKSLPETMKAIEGLKRKEYTPKGFIYSQNHITAISYGNSIYLPVIKTPIDESISNQYELIELSLYDKIDEEIINNRYIEDDRVMEVTKNKYITEGYELFRLELSEFLNNNPKVKSNLISLIDKKNMNEIKGFLYSVIDKELEREFRGQIGGFMKVEPDMVDIKGYRPKNQRELCHTLGERCSNSFHCMIHDKKCMFRASKELVIEYVNKLVNELLYNDVKKKEVLNLDNYYVSDIVNYDVYTKRSDQKIIKSDNNNIMKIMSELFGKNNVPIIGKKKVQKMDKSMMEENQRNLIRRAGDKYYQNIIHHNPLFRAYANGFYWRANSGANVIYRNLGYYSDLQTNLSKLLPFFGL
jgi:hypothetical protein